MTSLRYFRTYLNQRLQITGVNNSFSVWEDIIAGVPQESILGPLLGNYADDTTLYSIKTVLKATKQL